MATPTGSEAAPAVDQPGRGVEGNARITGAVGAAIFGLLIVEGITILRIGDLLTMHVFVGMLLVAFAAVKIGSTGYRVVRYYAGDAAYTAKGPPHVVLRLLGPVVVITTVAVLGTGIAAVLAGRHTEWLVQAHKASFIVWFGAMTVHVLGHIVETPALAVADLRRQPGARRSGAAARLALFAATVACAVLLGVVGVGWAHHWQAAQPHKAKQAVARVR